ncbi:unnamed protein product [marine sediment metagenome]|uniref:Uncharacterized protein n=1 Tax=marine sediment metagenome TaxID=412755 RepID=X1KYN5_9ZZZZ
MALVKYGAGIVQMSGSIAGNVHARNRFGNYIRPRTKPVNPRSDRQEDARTIMSYLAEYWHNDMSPTERGLWDVYADAVAMKNRLGETIHLTGFNHFMRSNTARMNVHPGPVTFAPEILSLPEKDPDLVCSAEDVAGQTFTFTNNAAFFAANGDQFVNLFLYQGLPQLASRNFFAGPWRYIGAFGVAEGQAGTVTLDAGHFFAAGQKVWFQARSYTNFGRLSELWQLLPHTVVAD